MFKFSSSSPSKKELVNLIIEKNSATTKQKKQINEYKNIITELEINNKINNRESEQTKDSESDNDNKCEKINFKTNIMAEPPIASTSSSKRTNADRSPDDGFIQVSKQVKKTQYRQTSLPRHWLSTENRFDPLNTEDFNTNDKVQPIPPIIKEQKPPRPPPLFIHGVQKIKPLIIEVEKLIEKRYTLKTLAEFKVRMQVENKEDYKKVFEMLKEKKTEFHSFQLKDERCFRVIIKNLHQATETEEIVEALKEVGHTVMNVSPVRSKRTGNDLPMFYINLKPQDNNKEVYDINRLLSTVVIVEPIRSHKEIPQCVQCQRFGHTQKYCHLGARCVKCTEAHMTENCPRKTRDTPVKCTNCGGEHPANYKGCIVYQNLRKKLYPQLREKIIEKSNKESFYFTNPKTSYAEALGGSKTTAINIQPQSNDMAELKQMMKGLMEQMSTMLNLLTVVVSKLK